MIRIENTGVYGFEAAIRGMRNPMNSWEKSDSFIRTCSKGDLDRLCDKNCQDPYCSGPNISGIGKNDLDLMIRLRNAGTDHRKFMRMITVTLDIVAPLYWWKEADTYSVGVVKNSCSTMHKIQAKEFTLADFSHEYLNEKSLYMLNDTIQYLNAVREAFIETKDKHYWWQMIQLLPSSYNQRRTVMLNYEVLTNIYHARKNHKLDEWHTFCDWIEELPHSELITNNGNEEL